MGQRIVAVMSGKGGVGKSSIAALAAQIVSEQHRTLILDFDICGPSMTTAFNVAGSLVKTQQRFAPLRVSQTLDVLSFGSILGPEDAVIWRGPKKQVFLNLFFNSAGGYDCVVIDTPPGISEEHSFLSDKDVQAIVVTTPQNVALNDTQRCIEFCQASGMDVLGVIENMSWTRCECCEERLYPFGNKGGAHLASEYGLRFLGQLPIEPMLSSIMDRGELPLRYAETKTYSALMGILKDCGVT